MCVTRVDISMEAVEYNIDAQTTALDIVTSDAICLIGLNPGVDDYLEEYEGIVIIKNS